MGKKDDAAKIFFQDKERVADLINACCYGGEQTVSPEDISDADPGGENGIRDIIKKTALGTKYAFIGIENQEEVDHTLPVRAAGYDVGDYRKQVNELKQKNRNDPCCSEGGEYLYGYRKTDKLIPVVTIVLYYGDNWTGPRSIKDMLDMDGNSIISQFVQDYKLNLLEICNLSDEDLEKFHTDVKQVFEFIKNRRDKEKMLQLIQNDPGYKNIDENAYRMMEVHGSLKGYRIMVEDYRTEKGGVDMCKAWDDWREDGRKEGREEGRREERINTERERKNAEKERQNAEEERRKTERALKRAEKAEAEIIKLKALLAEVRAQA